MLIEFLSIYILWEWTCQLLNFDFLRNQGTLFSEADCSYDPIDSVVEYFILH